MKIRAILFDLDGTLLPLEQDVFVNTYFAALVKATAQRGYDPHQIIKAIHLGTQAMVQNQGGKTNEAVLVDILVSVLGKNILQDLDLFDGFYEGEFQQIKHICGFNPQAKATIDVLKTKGII